MMLEMGHALHPLDLLVFIDIDGTMTDGTAREEEMERRGLVIGPYGSPSRQYPQGKAAFIQAFNHPSMFALDDTMAGAEAFIDRCRSISNIQIFYLTARDVEHHEAIRLDLERRRLWLPDMRLLCKPHRDLDTEAYKLGRLRTLMEALPASKVVYLENVASLRDGAVAIASNLHAFETPNEGLAFLEAEVRA